MLEISHFVNQIESKNILFVSSIGTIYLHLYMKKEAIYIASFSISNHCVLRLFSIILFQLPSQCPFHHRYKVLRDQF